MDPITQGVVGAGAAQLGARGAQFLKAATVGAVAGMAPDLDVLIRSESDPLLALEFHRHFTHSLFFIPIGGALVGCLLYWLVGKRWQLTLKQTLIWSILGFATHGLLDGCTTYGTQLLWPFSNKRFAWDLVSVVDPLVTLPVLGLLAVAVIKQSRLWIMVAGIWLSTYLVLGYIQHERAMAMGRDLAAERSHPVDRLTAKPSFGNILIWKTVYESDGWFYVDAVKPGTDTVWEGDKIAKLDVGRDFPTLKPGTLQARDIERFNWFSDGYTAVGPDNPNRIVDIRYSMLPQEIDPMWGIVLTPQRADREHVDYYTERSDGRRAMNRLWSMLWQ